MSKWIIKQMNDVGCTNCQCPECHEEFFFPRIVTDPYKYCPNCGAKLIEDEGAIE